MNKRGEINLDNPVGAIIGLFIFMIFGIIVVIIFSTMSNVISQDQCKTIQNRIVNCQIIMESCEWMRNISYRKI